ncbi:hypothetical protein TNCT_187941 [Trichonephila clavata]|uniref:Uncharacterized protein n=1 Tax=Trichonephila clavata TaxID=2740835 RepID=A0A8X6L405_TRICU|nr:hypothetical protein TNCT_187941 [Trichonephila clavata]
MPLYNHPDTGNAIQSFVFVGSPYDGTRSVQQFELRKTESAPWRQLRDMGSCIVLIGKWKMGLVKDRPQDAIHMTINVTRGDRILHTAKLAPIKRNARFDES